MLHKTKNNGFSFFRVAQSKAVADSFRSLLFCNRTLADAIKQQFGAPSDTESAFSAIAMKMLKLTQEVLDELRIPFWINSLLE
jgi:hypothetical protein